LSLVSESQSLLAPQPQGERLGSQLLRFQLQLDLAGADSPYLAEFAMLFRSGSANEMTTSMREGVNELIDIPSDRVVPIPHLPSAVIGVYNWRGEILWVVDLAIVLGSQGRRFDRHRRCYPTIVISSATDSGGQKKTIGLVVDEIADIEWCELDPTPTPTVEPSHQALSRWIAGYAIATTGAKLTILDELAIVDRAELDADI
jgi:positive phototaxis protein PixI